MAAVTFFFGPPPGRRRAGLLWVFAALFCLSIGMLVQVTLPEAAKERAQSAELSGPASGGSRTLRKSRADQLAAAFESAGFDLVSVRLGIDQVPRIETIRLPKDMEKVADPEVRKSIFLRTLMPLILMENERIREARKRAKDLFAAAESNQPIAPADRAWLEKTAEAYGLESPEQRALLSRLDVVPVSLALAQAIQESGWGQSRFAKEGNALYGQRVWSEEGRGLRAEDLDGDEGFKVRSFRNLGESVRAYMKNLNSHSAYEGLRKRRAVLRSQGRQPTGALLAVSLESYSEEGVLYVKRLLEIMESNDLAGFDHVTLVPRAG